MVQPKMIVPTDQDTPTPGAVVPEWLINVAALGWRVVAILALAVIVALLCSLLWTVTASIAVATVVAALFAPLVVQLTRRGRSRGAAAGLVWFAAIATIAGALLLLALAFLPYLGEVVARVDAGLAAVDGRLAALDIPPAVASAVRSVLIALRSLGGTMGEAVLGSISGMATVLLLSTFLVFFFLRDGDQAWRWAFQAFSPHKQGRITAAGQDALGRVGGYLRGTAVLSFLIAVTDLVFMLILGVPLAAPLAVLVFFAGFIPYFGGLATTIVIVTITFAAIGPWPVVILLAAIAVRNAILGYGVRPALYGRRTNLHPALVLVALPAGYQIAGVIGLFVAVPVTAIILAAAATVVAVVEPEIPPPLPVLVPAWLDRIAQWSWRLLAGLAMVAAVIAIFVTVPTLVIPLVLATVLAATVNPLVEALERRGQSRAKASAVAVGGGFLAVVVVLGLALGSLIGHVDGLVATVISGSDTMNGAMGGHLGMLVRLVTVGGGQTAETVHAIADGAATVAVIVVLSTLLTLYLLRDGGRLWGRLVVHAVPHVQDELRGAGKRAFDVLGGYMAGTAIISLVGAASQLLIMLVLGIDLALPIFVLSFFLCFIPYIGGFVSTGIALLVTASVGSPTDLVIMGIFTVVFNIVTGNVVGPIVYGKTAHLHPALVLIAIPAGAAIAGILGMFFVVPVLGVVVVTWRSVLAVIGARPASSALPERHGLAAAT
jgi:predicted PurR-regulated permease PerM